jgi:YHS domain-containing protein
MTNPIQNRPFIDPVCGMKVNPDTAAAETSHNGVQFYFCAQGCKQAFEANPEKYAVKKRKGFWGRYLDRLNKSTGGKPPACCH